MKAQKFEPHQIEPCGYHLLVELLEFDTKTAGGIELPTEIVNREQEAMTVAKLLKIGPRAFKNHISGCDSAEEWGVEVGDYVQIPSHAYMRVAGQKTNLVYVCDHDIKAKVIL